MSNTKLQMEETFTHQNENEIKSDICVCKTSVNRHCCFYSTSLPHRSVRKLAEIQRQLKTRTTTRLLWVQWKNSRCLQTIRTFDNTLPTSSNHSTTHLLTTHKSNWLETSERVVTAMQMSFYTCCCTALFAGDKAMWTTECVCKWGRNSFIPLPYPLGNKASLAFLKMLRNWQH